MKSSKRGTRTLSLVTKQDSASLDSHGQYPENGMNASQKIDSQDAISTTATSVPVGCNYGWKPEYARMQNSFDPHESWLMYQAKSYLGHEVTLEDAKELFSRIDPSTRKPRETPAALRPVGVLAALRALVAGGMILLASGCHAQISAGSTAPAQLEDPSLEHIATLPNGAANEVYKFYDLREGTVCYVVPTYRGVAMNCMVAKPGDGQ